MNLRLNTIFKIIVFVLVLLIIGSSVSYAVETEKIEKLTTKTINDEHLDMKDKVILYIPIITTLISLLIFLGGKDIDFVTKIVAGAVFLAYIAALMFSDGKLVFSIITIALGIIINLIFLLNENVSGSGKVLSSLTIAFIALTTIVSLI